jgi:hypothetical protein
MSFDLGDYIDVATRLTQFRERHPEGTLQGEWQMLEAGGQTFVVYRAEAYRSPDDPRPGVGTAWETVPGKTPYTKGSELQNAETSAWGRAIIAVGAADARNGVASREDVQNRRAEQEHTAKIDAEHKRVDALARQVPEEERAELRAFRREHGWPMSPERLAEFEEMVERVTPADTP